MVSKEVYFSGRRARLREPSAMTKKPVSGGGAGPTSGGNGKIIVLAALIWLALLAFHANKALGHNPSVIPDEYTYISDIRHRPFSEAMIPNYLYYAIFSLTGLFGQRFLDAARVMNAAIFMLSIPFVHLVARRVTDWKTSIFIALLTAAWPISINTAYFTPESSYFTGFWIFAWLFLGAERLDRFRLGLLAGALIGLLSLLKVHGAFLLPGFAMFVLAETPYEGMKIYARKIALAGIASAGAFALTRFGLCFVLAGSGGMRLLGTAYGDLAREGIREFEALPFIGHSLYNLLGNIIALCAVTALPLALALKCLPKSGASAGVETDRRLRRTAIFAFSFMLPLMLTSAAFSGMLALVYSVNTIPEAERVQWRYYSFMLPMLIIITAGFIQRMDGPSPSPGARRWRDKAVFVPILALGLYASLTMFRGYNLFDPPELGSLAFFPPAFYAATLLSLALHVWAAFRPRRAGRLYLYLFLPCYALAATSLSYCQVALSPFALFDNLYARAGKFAREYLGNECADLTLVDPTINNATEALIHIDDPKTDLLAEWDGNLDMSRVKPGKKWLMTFGETYKVPDDRAKFSLTYYFPFQTREMLELARAGGRAKYILCYTLTRIADIDYSVDLGGGNPWPVRSVESSGREIRIRYAKPLPKRLSAALAPPAGAELPRGSFFRLVIGGSSIRLPASPDRARTASTDGKTDTLGIIWEGSPSPGPDPWKSPAARGLRLFLTAVGET